MPRSMPNRAELIDTDYVGFTLVVKVTYNDSLKKTVYNYTHYLQLNHALYRSAFLIEFNVIQMFSKMAR